MIGKGAALDSEYYDREGVGITFQCISQNLRVQRQYTVFEGTPLLHAAKKANCIVVQRLQEFGADTQVLGKQYLFKIEITGISKEVHFFLRPSKDFGCTWEEQERVVVETRNVKEAETHYRLDEELHLVETFVSLS